LSQPRTRHSWLPYLGAGFLLLVLGSTYLTVECPKCTGFVQALSALAMFGLMAALIAWTYVAARNQRTEMQQVEAIEELVQLRRWPQAALLIQSMLSQPTRSMVARVQALIYLSSVLARYQRFEDAIGVQTYLLTHVNLDEGTAHGLRLGRAMAMLREDHLVDADRAISDLRRSSSERESAGLALVEIYRDVKTGHPAEAVEIFEQKLEPMRQQLGHRVSDAWALVAKAYEMLNRDADARSAWDNATILSPTSELQRRYPELVSLAEKFGAANGPAVGEQA
jgi:tetratricopeptide (TPR) repeat protein